MGMVVYLQMMMSRKMRTEGTYLENQSLSSKDSPVTIEKQSILFFNILFIYYHNSMSLATHTFWPHNLLNQ